MKSLKPLFFLFLTLAAITFCIVYLIPKIKNDKKYSDADGKGGLDMVENNYGKAIDSAAHVFELPPEYFKALCMLECTGRKAFPERLEPHVLERLKEVKFKRLNNYEHVTPEMLSDANEEALKNLASSWGPFQLMGYKCLLLDIKVRDIRGEDAVFHGIKWIDMTYGDKLKAKKFKDAFHIHNTGKPYPVSGKATTYDPDYVNKGLAYMKHFGYDF